MPTQQSKPVAYSVHPSVQYVRNIIDRMKVKTGRSIDEWVAFTKKSGPKDEPSRCDWLKSEHGLGTNYASRIAARCDGRGKDDGDAAAYLKAAKDYVENMYAGRKAHLRPIHDALIQLGLSLGRDVKVCPCETIVPLYRTRVFAQIKPATLTRIDFGLCLRDVKGKIPARVIETGGASKNDRITHRIPIASIEQVDSFVEQWVRKAYDSDQ